MSIDNWIRQCLGSEPTRSRLLQLKFELTEHLGVYKATERVSAMSVWALVIHIFRRKPRFLMNLKEWIPQRIVRLINPLLLDTHKAPAMQSRHLPDELWRDIFIAAIGHERYDTRDLASDYTPFQSTYEYSTESPRHISLSISLVCTQWHDVISEFLYQQIHLGHGTAGLLEALGRKTGYPSKPTVGHYVQCIELPSIADGHLLDEPCSIYEILARTPLVKCIVKGTLGTLSMQSFWTALASPSPAIENITLDRLERVEWSSRMGRLRYSDHLDVVYPILHTIILKAPNLRYLSINDWKEGMFQDKPRQVLFPSLETLRLRGATGFLSAGVVRSDIPQLSRLIVEPMNLYYRFDVEEPEILQAIGKQIRSLELDGSPAGSENSYMGLGDLLASCPSLEEICFQPGAPPLFVGDLDEPHESLKTLRIFADVGRHQRGGLYQSRYWELVIAALEYFLVPGHFPALSCISIHGDADAAITSIRTLHSVFDTIKEREIRLEYGDGRLIH